jgi:hypothetical protein
LQKSRDRSPPMKLKEVSIEDIYNPYRLLDRLDDSVLQYNQ